MQERLTDLEIRISHQEAALDELTRTVLAQEHAVTALRAEMAQLRRLLAELVPGLGAGADEPPPHY